MRSATLLVVAVALGACSKGPKTEAAPPAPAPVQAPHAAAPSDVPAPEEIRGKVLETLDAAGYTYVRLQTAGGETWAAIPQTALAVGSEAVIAAQMKLEHFESKALSRKFEPIYFGSIAAPGGAKAIPHDAAAAAAPAVEKLERAPGASGRTVADVHAQRAKLAGSKVSVRGKVVKATGGILGKNWLHLQDGTGSAATQDDDLVVTTTLEASEGDVLVVEGTVRVDQDLGSGYFYPVLVEDAVFTRPTAATR